MRMPDYETLTLNLVSLPLSPLLKKERGLGVRLLILKLIEHESKH